MKQITSFKNKAFEKCKLITHKNFLLRRGTSKKVFCFLVEITLWRALKAIQYNKIQYDTAQHNSTQNNTIHTMQCTTQYTFLGIQAYQPKQLKEQQLQPLRNSQNHKALCTAPRSKNSLHYKSRSHAMQECELEPLTTQALSQL